MLSVNRPLVFKHFLKLSALCMIFLKRLPLKLKFTLGIMLLIARTSPQAQLMNKFQVVAKCDTQMKAFTQQHRSSGQAFVLKVCLLKSCGTDACHCTLLLKVGIMAFAHPTLGPFYRFYRLEQYWKRYWIIAMASTQMRQSRIVSILFFQKHETFIVFSVYHCKPMGLCVYTVTTRAPEATLASYLMFHINLGCNPFLQ